MRQATSELIDEALNWAVAQAEGRRVHIERGRVIYGANDTEGTARFNPAGNEGHALLIQEHEKIGVEHGGDAFDAWVARYKPCEGDDPEWVAPRPHIAILRCYVVHKLGEEVDVPDELAAPTVAATPAPRMKP